jgi:uncharacterized protein (DUF1697 family)
MADLRELFDTLGAEEVTTYAQSGNVVFKSPDRQAELIPAVEERISHALGLEVTVLLRTKAQLGKVLRRQPVH